MGLFPANPAAGARPHLRRIVVLGCAGAGKSTLAARLAAATGASHICLDSIWRPGWGPAEVPAFRAQVAEAHAGDCWISDGNFALATFDLRLPRAELILWLEPPRLACTAAALVRPFRHGEAHRLSGLPKVLRYIRTFATDARPRIEAARQQHGPQVPVIRLRSRTQMAAFLAEGGRG